MQEVMYNSYVKEVLDILPKGAFLSVSNGKADNTMTIGWGSIGPMWGKPIFTVMVRYSRYTYQLMESADAFTVSIPLKADVKKALGFCGRESGRNHDKWKEAGLTKLQAHRVNAPLVGECDLHYECKIVGKQALSKDILIPNIDTACYSNGDYHVLYYGEIVGTYLK